MLFRRPTPSDRIGYFSFFCWEQYPDGYYVPSSDDGYCYEEFTYCKREEGTYAKTRVSGPTSTGTPSCNKEAGDAVINECFIHHTILEISNYNFFCSLNN